MGRINSARDTLIKTQTHLKGTFSSIQTNARSYPLCFTQHVNMYKNIYNLKEEEQYRTQ